MKKDITILAPHADDELIGCFSVLRKRQVKRVIYFYDLVKERQLEAIKTGKKFGFIPDFSGFDLLLHNLTGRILIPTRDDNHPHHKEVNDFSKKLSGEKGYYSVDLNKRCNILTPRVRKEKENALNECYPSQSELWNSDAKYILFERITKKDHRFFAKVKHNFSGIHRWKDAKNYLNFPHRHQFYITMLLEMYHNDREIEFISLKEELVEFCNLNFDKLDGMSCEMIGEEIKLYFEISYPKRDVRVEVSEDNENGMIII